MPRSLDIVDWSVAARVAKSVAGGGPAVSPNEARAISAEFRDHVERADALVRSYTGMTPLEPPGRTAVLSRAAWIDANLDTIRSLLAPLDERLRAAFARRGFRAIGGKTLGLQMGVLLGYLSQKVLGQYDLLLAGDEPGRVYFVGPNIVAAERRHGLEPRDFRLWIALHEVTHRTQFQSVPWLRERVTALIERYLSGIQLDAGRVRELVRRAAETLSAGPDAWRQANLVSIFLSGDQREAIEEMQSLMSVVEGHGNFVMDGVAEKEIPSYARLREALAEHRAQAGAAERTFQKLIALDMKYAQYATGQAFFDAVFHLGGMEAVNRVWERPENLPSTEEFADAESWLARVQPQPTLFDS